MMDMREPSEAMQAAEALSAGLGEALLLPAIGLALENFPGRPAGVSPASRLSSCISQFFYRRTPR